MFTSSRAVVLCMAVLTLASVRAGAQHCYSDYGAAAAAAESGARPLLVIFEQENCPDCERLEAALRHGKSRTALRNAVMVKLDYSSNPHLANEFNVTATPTIVLLKVSDGALRTVYRNVGSLQVSGIVSLGRRIDGLMGQPNRIEDPMAAKTLRPKQERGAALTNETAVAIPPESAPPAIATHQSAHVPGVRGNYFFYKPGGLPYDQQ